MQIRSKLIHHFKVEVAMRSTILKILLKLEKLLKVCVVLLRILLHNMFQTLNCHSISYMHFFSFPGCSYYAARSMADDAQLIFCPYSYIINPVIRGAMDVDIKEAILILDEAQYVFQFSVKSAQKNKEFNKFYIFFVNHIVYINLLLLLIWAISTKPSELASTLTFCEQIWPALFFLFLKVFLVYRCNLWYSICGSMMFANVQVLFISFKMRFSAFSFKAKEIACIPWFWNMIYLHIC